MEEERGAVFNMRLCGGKEVYQQGHCLEDGFSQLFWTVLTATNMRMHDLVHREGGVHTQKA